MSVIAGSRFVVVDDLELPGGHRPFAPPVPEAWTEFEDLRQTLLSSYGYNTERAYWSDLQDWFEWAVARGKDVLALTERDRKQYVALLRRRKYSENTVRRRLSTLRLLMALKSAS